MFSIWFWFNWLIVLIWLFVYYYLSRLHVFLLTLTYPLSPLLSGTKRAVPDHRRKLWTTFAPWNFASWNHAPWNLAPRSHYLTRIQSLFCVFSQQEPRIHTSTHNSTHKHNPWAYQTYYRGFTGTVSALPSCHCLKDVSIVLPLFASRFSSVTEVGKLTLGVELRFL